MALFDKNKLAQCQEVPGRFYVPVDTGRKRRGGRNLRPTQNLEILAQFTVQFTEHGAVMLASVLNSDRVIKPLDLVH